MDKERVAELAVCGASVGNTCPGALGLATEPENCYRFWRAIFRQQHLQNSISSKLSLSCDESARCDSLEHIGWGGKTKRCVYPKCKHDLLGWSSLNSRPVEQALSKGRFSSSGRPPLRWSMLASRPQDVVLDGLG